MQGPTLREWLEAAERQTVQDGSGRTIRFSVVVADEVLAILDRMESAEEALDKARFSVKSYARLAQRQRGCPYGCPCTDCEFAEDLRSDLGMDELA